MTVSAFEYPIEGEAELDTSASYLQKPRNGNFTSHAPFRLTWERNIRGIFGRLREMTKTPVRVIQW